MMRGERERTDGSERSSANLRACSLLGVLLTVASEEAPKLLLEEEDSQKKQCENINIRMIISKKRVVVLVHNYQ